MDNVIKILDRIDDKILTLQIQLAQLQNDAAARGSMVVVESLRKELLELEETFKNK